MIQIAGLQGSQDQWREGEGGGGGKSMAVKWGAHVLILDLKFQVCDIIWGLKFRIPKSAFWGA